MQAGLWKGITRYFWPNVPPVYPPNEKIVNVKNTSVYYDYYLLLALVVVIVCHSWVYFCIGHMTLHHALRFFKSQDSILVLTKEWNCRPSETLPKQQSITLERLTEQSYRSQRLLTADIVQWGLLVWPGMAVQGRGPALKQSALRMDHVVRSALLLLFPPPHHSLLIPARSSLPSSLLLNLLAPSPRP